MKPGKASLWSAPPLGRRRNTAPAARQQTTVAPPAAQQPPPSRDDIYRLRPSQLVLDVRSNELDAEIFLDPFGPTQTPATTAASDRGKRALFRGISIKSITASSVSSGLAPLSNRNIEPTPAPAVKRPASQYTPNVKTSSTRIDAVNDSVGRKTGTTVDCACQTDFDFVPWAERTDLTESDREYLEMEYRQERRVADVNDIFADPEMRAMDWFAGVDVPLNHDNYRPTAPDAEMMDAGQRFGPRDDSPFGRCSSPDGWLDEDDEGNNTDILQDDDEADRLAQSAGNWTLSDHSGHISGVSEREWSPSRLRTRNFRLTPPDNALRPQPRRANYHGFVGGMPTSPPSSERTAFTVPSETGSESSISAHSIVSSSLGGRTLSAHMPPHVSNSNHNSSHSISHQQHYLKELGSSLTTCFKHVPPSVAPQQHGNDGGGWRHVNSDDRH